MSAEPSPVRLLFVAGRAGDPLTETFRDDLLALAGATVTTWYLDAGETPAPPGTEVVADLRPRGRRHRWSDIVWGRRVRQAFRRVRPEIVVIDEGVGGHVVPRRSRVLVVHRITERTHHRPAGRQPHVVVSDLGRADRRRHGVSDDRRVLAPGPAPERLLDADLAASAAGRTMARATMGLDADLPLAVGWFGDGGTDPDALVALCRRLRERRGLAVGVLWLDPGVDPGVARVHRQRAAAADPDGSFVLRPFDTDAARSAADVALLAVDPADLRPSDRAVLERSGLPLVSTAGDVAEEELIERVARALGAPRAPITRPDAGPDLGDDLLAALMRHRGGPLS